jgi:hypothetical protein
VHIELAPHAPHAHALMSPNPRLAVLLFVVSIKVMTVVRSIGVEDGGRSKYGPSPSGKGLTSGVINLICI